MEKQPLYQGQFVDAPRDPRLTVELVMIERPVGDHDAWGVTGAITRSESGPAEWVEGHTDPNYRDSDAEKIWTYLTDKGGGNGINYDAAFVWIAEAADAPDVIAIQDDHLAREGHPLGYSGGKVATPVNPKPQLTSEDPAEPSDRVQAEEPDSKDSCAGHRHVDMPFPIADVLSWQVIVELVRRHPADLWVMRTHPFEIYDCLSVRRLEKPWSVPTIALNRNGTHVKVDWFGDLGSFHENDLMSWGDPLEAPDPRDWLLELERLAGLRSPTQGLPASTPSSLSLRWISRFLSLQLGARDRWTAWTVDSADDDPYGCFEAIPGALTWVRSQTTQHPAYYVWFVGDARTRSAQFALSADGDLWSRDHRQVSLPAEHTSKGSITGLVARTSGLPLP